MSTMPIKTLLRVAKKLPASTSILIRGDHGIGKSQIVRQIAAVIAHDENITNFDVIDRRLSQMTEGDMIGLPSIENDSTRFNPPDWYKQACEKPCVLFLDELNRATPEVMQAAFQIVLDRCLNGWYLHPQTRVFAAINTGAVYNVNEVDPALLDRFWVIDLLPNTEDWVEWAGTKNVTKPHGHNCLPVVVEFIQNQEKWLDPPKKHEPNTVHPSRRSWERLGDALALAHLDEQPTDPDFYSLCTGYVGTEAAIAFTDFVKTIDNQISGEEILNDWDKVQKKVARLGQERFNIAIDKVAEYAHTQGKLTPVHSENLRKFTQLLPKELRIVLWSKMVEDGMNQLQLAKDTHNAIYREILDCFGVNADQQKIGGASIPTFQNQPASTSDKKKRTKRS